MFAVEEGEFETQGPIDRIDGRHGVCGCGESDGDGGDRLLACGDGGGGGDGGGRKEGVVCVLSVARAKQREGCS